MLNNVWIGLQGPLVWVGFLGICGVGHVAYMQDCTGLSFANDHINFVLKKDDDDDILIFI
jgi:hypothetical protein